MHRNLNRRMEVLAPVLSTATANELGTLLDVAFDEGTEAWHLGPDCTRTRRATNEHGEPLLGLRAWLLQKARERKPSPT